MIYTAVEIGWYSYASLSPTTHRPPRAAAAPSRGRRNHTRWRRPGRPSPEARDASWENKARGREWEY